MKYIEFKNEKEIKRKLQKEIDIPENVQKSVDDALERMSGIKNAENKTTISQRQVKYFGQKRVRFATACLALALLVIGGTAGAYSVWSHFEQERYGITEKNRDYLKQEKVLNEESLKTTQNGMTVESVETVAAGTYAHVLLKITVPKGTPLDTNIVFRKIEALENNKWNVNYNGSVSVDEETGKIVADKEKGIFYYELILSTLEYQGDEEKESEKNENRNWDGQILNLTLEDLEYYSPSTGEEKVLVEGNWDLDIPMKASEETKEYYPGTKLASGAIVEKITLTPISIEVTYDYPMQEETVPYVEDNSDAELSTSYSTGETTELKEPEMPYRYELKNGEVNDLAVGMGRLGYNEGDTKHFIAEFSTEKVLDCNQITAIYIGDQKVELK